MKKKLLRLGSSIFGMAAFFLLMLPAKANAGCISYENGGSLTCNSNGYGCCYRCEQDFWGMGCYWTGSGNDYCSWSCATNGY